MDDDSAIFKNDASSIFSQIKNQEERIRLKRRWLLGGDISESEKTTDFLKSEFLPESLLREDDIFCETVKSHVEKAFGLHENEEVVQQKDSKLCAPDVIRQLDLNLDSLTNKALYLTATIITGGSTSFEKTRLKMKQIIRESIKKDFRKKNEDDDDTEEKTDIVKQLHQVLTDSRNFREDCMMDLATPSFHSRRDAAMKVLDELDKLKTQTLLAMKRKLKGSRTIPQLKSSKCNRSRSYLINQVKQISEKMLLEISEGDELPEKLAKALSLVDLSLKLPPGYKTASAADFYQFSPETKNLQNEIVKAIWLLKKVRIHELKRMHLLLDPEAEVSNDSLRSSIRKMLIEYLFECSDMDIIPESFLKALSLVNRSSKNVDHKVSPKEAIEEETECVLNVSAQVKELLWGCIPNHELDEDFDDAYMEELEDSDDDFDDDDDEDDDKKDTQDDEIDSSDSDHEESGAECSVLNTGGSSSVNKVVVRDLTESTTRIHPRYVTPTSNKSTPHDVGTSKTRVKGERDVEMEVDNQFSSRSLFSVENVRTDDHHGEQRPQRRNKNQYLALQGIADETSLVAHNLIGRLLEKFADQKGVELEEDERSYLGGKSRSQEDVEVSEASSSHEKSDESIMVSAVEEIMPSLDKSVLMKLKELMEI